MKMVRNAVMFLFEARRFLFELRVFDLKNQTSIKLHALQHFLLHLLRQTCAFSPPIHPELMKGDELNVGESRDQAEFN